MVTRVTGSSDNTFKTLTALVAATGIREGQTYKTLGYTTEGDGGGNDYIIMSNTFGRVDAKKVIQLTGSPYRASSIDNELNVYQSGYTDDAVLSVYPTKLYNDEYGHVITGQEYAWLVPRMAELNETAYASYDAIFSGDSTTFGVNAAGFEPHVIFKECARNLGYGFVETYNEGHSGGQTTEWGVLAGWFDDDITEEGESPLPTLSGSTQMNMPNNSWNFMDEARREMNEANAKIGKEPEIKDNSEPEIVLRDKKRLENIE